MVIRQRCLTGLILTSIAAAILNISLALAQPAPPEPAASQNTPDSLAARPQTPGGDEDEPANAVPEILLNLDQEQTDSDDRQGTDHGQAEGDDTVNAPFAGQVEPAPGQTQELATEKNPASRSETSGSDTSQSDVNAHTRQQQATPDEAAADAEPNLPQAETTAQPPAVAQPATPAAPALDPKDVTLKIAIWGGAYGQSQERAFFKPFAERYGYQIETVTYDGAYDELAEQGDEPKWSLVDLNGETMIRACDEGRLERLDFTILEPSPDGAPLSEDFLPGAIHPCGVASVAWSAVIVYDKGLTSKPASLEDFFDISKIPGKRLLPKQPRYSLELALMADGVAPDQVYATLKTAQGQDRAFKKLSSIKDDLVWWDTPSEVFGRIADKEAIMGLAFNGRAFMAMVGSQQPIEILWDRQIYSFDYWSIPRGAPFPQVAKDFIRFATSAGPLSDQARWLPYGPARRSALLLVGRHAELDLEMKRFLPTYEPNFARALAFDGAFWAVNEDALNQRFADWVEGRQLPPQKAAAISQ